MFVLIILFNPFNLLLKRHEHLWFNAYMFYVWENKLRCQICALDFSQSKCHLINLNISCSVERVFISGLLTFPKVQALCVTHICTHTHTLVQFNIIIIWLGISWITCTRDRLKKSGNLHNVIDPPHWALCCRWHYIRRPWLVSLDYFGLSMSHITHFLCNPEWLFTVLLRFSFFFFFKLKATALLQYF